MEFSLKEHEFIASAAIYKEGSGTDQWIFEYIVATEDNANDIDFSGIQLNSAVVIDSKGSPPTTQIYNKDFSSEHDINIDNVSSVLITMDGIYENDISSNKTPTVHVSGRDIVGFQYKITDSYNSCTTPDNYINVDATSTQLDLSNEISGAKVLCALGKTSTGFVKPYNDGPSSFNWQFDSFFHTS